MRLIFAILALSFFACSAQASILDLPSNEKTAEIISVIFNDDSILARMSAVLNAGCLLFALLMIGFTAISGTLSTAHEGQVLGKAYNSLWVPIRVVITLAMLLPMTSGFSVAQYFVMDIAKYGAGLASSTWNAALNHMENEGTLYPPPAGSGEKLASALLRNNGCLESVNRQAGHNAITREVSTASSSDSYRLSARYSGAGVDMSEHWRGGATSTPALLSFEVRYPIDVCGRVDLVFQKVDEEHVSSEAKIDYMLAMQNALAELEASMYALARKLVNVSDPTVTGNELSLAAVDYNNAMRTALHDAVASLAEKREADTSWLSEAQDLGFVGAGAWYLDFTRLHSETFDFAAMSPTTKAPAATLAGNDYNANMARIIDYLGNRNTINQYGETVRASEQSDDDDILDKLSKNLQAKIRESVEGMEDPTLALQSIGHGIINSLYVIGGAALAAKVAAKGASSSLWVKIIPGGGAAAGAYDAIASELLAAFKLIAGLLFIPAAFLAFYLPMIPFILWIMGLAGWVVLLIESLVAAPIWAAAHSIPEGNGAINNHAKAGYMILLSLFFRPTLMLFGFFGAMFANIIIHKLALSLFLPAVLSASADHAVGLVSIVSYILILTGLMVMTTHRAFGLIHEIPDKVLRYIGSQGENLGESSGEAHGRSIVAGVVSRSEKVVGPSPGGGGQDASSKGGDSSSSGNTLTQGKTQQNHLAPVNK